MYVHRLVYDRTRFRLQKVCALPFMLSNSFTRFYNVLLFGQLYNTANVTVCLACATTMVNPARPAIPLQGQLHATAAGLPSNAHLNYRGHSSLVGPGGVAGFGALSLADHRDGASTASRAGDEDIVIAGGPIPANTSAGNKKAGGRGKILQRGRALLFPSLIAMMVILFCLPRKREVGHVKWHKK
ncbi:hypothetical protein BJ138DRAFT_594395 [Hygrophoropsis aurantiaca]|uniref:Uncharacterized protein n=1 Tax=Hygrophoropsis aurantiaca TaxID=72124 RepID=A0ACB8ASN6_9AGAM|nr:hypothetical protein BJ138DRAFT_594395 [Hygrophoropsis aurantiaca]